MCKGDIEYLTRDQWKYDQAEENIRQVNSCDFLLNNQFIAEQHDCDLVSEKYIPNNQKEKHWLKVLRNSR